MLLRTLWEPVYWPEYDEYYYRLVKYNGKETPKWVTPAIYSEGIAHDIFDHIRWSSLYPLDDEYTESNLNEIWSLGVYSSHSHYKGYRNIALNIYEFLEFINDDIISSESIKVIPKPKNTAEFKLFTNRVVTGGSFYKLDSDCETTRKLLYVAYRGYKYGKKYPLLGDVRDTFINQFPNYWVEKGSTSPIDSKCMHKIYVYADISRGYIQSRPVPMRDRIEVYKEY